MTCNAAHGACTSHGAYCRKRRLVFRMAGKGHQAVQKPGNSSGCTTRAKLKEREKQQPIILKKGASRRILKKKKNF